jgi:hypothetical protein
MSVLPGQKPIQSTKVYILFLLGKRKLWLPGRLLYISKLHFSLIGVCLSPLSYSVTNKKITPTPYAILNEYKMYPEFS